VKNQADGISFLSDRKRLFEAQDGQKPQGEAGIYARLKRKTFFRG